MLNITMLHSTQCLINKLHRQMGTYAFIRYQRNLGISFEDAYFHMFGKMPESKG